MEENEPAYFSAEGLKRVEEFKRQHDGKYDYSTLPSTLFILARDIVLFSSGVLVMRQYGRVRTGGMRPAPGNGILVVRY